MRNGSTMLKLSKLVSHVAQLALLDPEFRIQNSRCGQFRHLQSRTSFLFHLLTFHLPHPPLPISHHCHHQHLTHTHKGEMSYRKIDSSDPRRPELVRPLVLPKTWSNDDLDIYSSFLGSVSMVSGAAMLTRASYIAYGGLVFACAHIAHDKPFKSSKTKDASTGGPWMSLA